MYQIINYKSQLYICLKIFICYKFQLYGDHFFYLKIDMNLNAMM